MKDGNSPHGRPARCPGGFAARVRLPFAFVLAVCVAPVHAQLRVPAVQLPNAPGMSLPIDVRADLPRAQLSVDASRLRDARKLQVRTLIRSNRGEIEADPAGEAMVRNQVLAYSPAPATLNKLRAAGFTVLRESVLEGLDASVVVLAAPSEMSTATALRRLQSLDPQGVYDFNHLYAGSGAISATGVRTAPAAEAAQTNVQPAVVKIGLIDGGVDDAHPAFQGASLRHWGCSGQNVSSAHGTAVASILIGQDGVFHGAAPQSQLYSADVYCGSATGGAVEIIAAAFAWMAREQIPVINVSLVGPKNAMLEQIVRIVIARGHVVVAAVGNDGPSAPPLYPAAYADVVGVTAVDAHQRVLLEAGRGPQVAFAAPGADMVGAGGDSAFVAVRGTSFAAPIVAGLLALRLPAIDKHAADAVLAQLAQEAVDLGPPGKDKIYGNGLVGEQIRVDPARMALSQVAPPSSRPGN